VRIQTAITCYAAPLRLAKIFETMETSGWPAGEIVVYEDLSNDDRSKAYAATVRRVADRGEHVVIHRPRPTWGGMQGTAQFAAEQAAIDGAEWVIYFPDDVLPTPGVFSWLEKWLPAMPDHVGAVQIPYWNYDVMIGVEDILCDSSGQLRREIDALGQRDKKRAQLFSDPTDWLADVPWNPHWYGPAFYINVNGAGFAFRIDAWKAAGGFPTKTWCLDEHLGARLWLHTNYTVVTIPGPPIIHMGGASTADQFAFGHAHLREATNDGWFDEWGVDKETLGNQIRECMELAHRKYGMPRR